MTPASPPPSSAQVLFFSRIRQPQAVQHAGRISTWPFRVVRDARAANDIRLQTVRVLRVTADSWWPPEV